MVERMDSRILYQGLAGLYILLLIKFVVFKDMDMLLVGHMRFYFGGTQTGDANWIPLKTIANYFTEKNGLLIAGLNLAGNLLILAPIGFLLPAGFPKISWKPIFILAISISLSIEIVQLLCQLGIFDVDDILLNSMGFIFGYYVSTWISGTWHKALTFLFAALLLSSFLYYLSHSVPMNPMPPK